MPHHLATPMPVPCCGGSPVSTSVRVPQEDSTGTSLAVQWVRARAPNAGGAGPIPARGARSCMSLGAAKGKKRREASINFLFDLQTDLVRNLTQVVVALQ